MADTQMFDLVVIGGGPGGYVAAIRGAQAGLTVACIDENDIFGGTCLRVGCIPSKAMLESSERYEQACHHLAEHGVKVASVKLDLKTMLKRQQSIVQTMGGGIAGLFKKHKVTAFQGRGTLLGDQRVSVALADGKKATLEAENIILATGSVAASLRGIDVKGVASNAEALNFSKVPEKLAVIGAGYIGIELGSVWRRLGAQVTVLEYLDRILPGMDSDIAADARRIFEKQGLVFKLKSKVTGIERKNRQFEIQIEGQQPLVVDQVLMAVGRAPNTANLGLDQAGIHVDDRGFIPVDDHFQTSTKGIYAIGDVIATPMLAHVAEEEGIACVDGITGQSAHIDYDVIPAIIYTHPEIASVGKTEDQLKDEAADYRKGVFHLRANGRAHALAATDGKVKVLADAKTDRILGVQIIGVRAGDLIAECAAAMAFGASSEDIARVCHAHPTLSEAVKEAAMAVTGKAIHQ